MVAVTITGAGKRLLVSAGRQGVGASTAKTAYIEVDAAIACERA